MSMVRFFQPENRLGKALTAAGGKKIEAAIADAEEQVELAAAESTAKIDETLEVIYRLAAGGVKGQAEALYQNVREVAGLAGIAGGLDELGAAALTFCRLLDLMAPRGGPTEDQVQVNVGVMRLLRYADRFAPKERQDLLDNLQAVQDKAKRSAG